MTTPSTKPSLPFLSQRKLRLQPHLLSSIPSHPSLTTATTTSTTTNPPLRPFILSLISEAITFADEFIPAHFTLKGEKSSSPSIAKVQLLTYEERSAGENWFGRRSEHVDSESKGTASWREFGEGIYDDHSIHEKEYTPDVFDAHKVLDWDDEIERITAEQGWDGYEDVHMEIYEMAHSIPNPLQNRIFPVLITRARTPSITSGLPSFIVVQIPIDLGSVPASLYSSGRHRRESVGGGKSGEKVTLGAYVSVERCRFVPGGGEGGKEGTGRGKTVWEMATASDAKGNLPMALQKMGVPGAVIKDVGFFVGWVGVNRGKKGGR